MTDAGDVTWPLEPHTRAKHDLLRRYLGAWFPIMARASNKLVFLDGFAGPGSYSGGEPGSPLIALRTLCEHQDVGMKRAEYVLVFNEMNVPRYRRLEQNVAGLLSEYGKWPPNVKVRLSNSGFKDLVTDILSGIGERQLAPTFAFVDPFGYKDVSMDLLTRFLAYPKCELFIYFDYNSVNRFATAHVVDDRFTELYGTDRYQQAPPSGDPRRGGFLRDLYAAQLQSVAGFEFVQRFEMVNQTGHTGHFLFYCTRSYTGLSAMKSAMWKVDPTGEYRFSDLLNGQPVLFEVSPSTAGLQADLSRTFRGQTVTIDQIERHVVVHTPFAKEHVRKQTLKPMQDAGLITSPNQRRRGTYPEGTLVAFA